MTVGILCFLSCTGEDVGRRLDPGYDLYLKNRTYQQKNNDEETNTKIQADYYARQNNSAAEIQFNSKLDSLSKKKRKTEQDSLNSHK